MKAAYSENLPAALLIARLCLGLMFFLLGWHKVFAMGPMAHAESAFVEPFADTFLPAWLLWAGGIAIPFIELTAGGLILIGYRRRSAQIMLALVLVAVIFGHMLADPFYGFHSHVMPRLLLLLFIMAIPPNQDRFSLDEWLSRSRG